MATIGRIRIHVPALLLAATASAAGAQARATDGMAWLAGCWQRHSGATVVEEQWMAPRGGLLMGAGRTVVRDTVRDYEVLRIFERGDTLVLAAHPRNQPPAEFRAVRPDPTDVTFENPAHDFPQRIIYRRGTADSLFARIEGVRGGQTRGIDFRYARVPCGATGGR